MPETTITIDCDQRGRLYELVRDHLGGIETSRARWSEPGTSPLPSGWGRSSPKTSACCEISAGASTTCSAESLVSVLILIEVVV